MTIWISVEVKILKLDTKEKGSNFHGPIYIFNIKLDFYLVIFNIKTRFHSTYIAQNLFYMNLRKPRRLVVKNCDFLSLQWPLL